jgi:hypothetical protein
VTADRRRALWLIVVPSVIALLGVAVFVLQHLRPGTLSTLSISAASSASATASETCADLGFVLLFSVTPATAKAGQPLDVRLRVRNTTGRQCSRTFSTFTVSSLWKEPTPYTQSTCRVDAPVTRSLGPGEDFEWAATTWAASPGGCPWAVEPGVVVPAGAWHGTVTAHYGTLTSTVVVAFTNT